MTTNPTTTTRERAWRVILFAISAGILFVGLLWTSSKIRFGHFTLLQCLTETYVEPGGEYQSLRRFREAESRGHVDIAFFGSSHAYRGFDPRVFEQAGYRVMNLGSTNQSPINSEHLVDRYAKPLSPSLVVFEVYDANLTSDGLESFRDLAVNTEASASLLEMAIATNNFGACSFAAAKLLGFTADVRGLEQANIAGETYVPGGFCEANGHRNPATETEPVRTTLNINESQLRALVRASTLASSFGAHVVWVTHPSPIDQERMVVNRDDVRRAIAAKAREAGIPYWDFDTRMHLDPIEDFRDLHHLSQTGVVKFDTAFIEALEHEGLLRRGAVH